MSADLETHATTLREWIASNREQVEASVRSIVASRAGVVVMGAGNGRSVLFRAHGEEDDAPALPGMTAIVELRDETGVLDVQEVNSVAAAATGQQTAITMMGYQAAEDVLPEPEMGMPVEIESGLQQEEEDEARSETSEEPTEYGTDSDDDDDDDEEGGGGFLYDILSYEGRIVLDRLQQG